MSLLEVGYSFPILSNISFDIKSEEKVIITGFNGIGKTKLLKILVEKIPTLKGDFLFFRKYAVRILGLRFCVG